MPKKLSEFTTLLTDFEDTDRLLIAREGSELDSYTTIADLVAYISGVLNPADPAAAYIARLTGTYSGPELTAIEAFFTSLMGDDLVSGGSMLDAIQYFWLRATDNVVDSRLNIISDTSPLVDVTPGSIIFTARQGVNNDGASQIDTDVNPSVVATTPTGIVGVYVRSSNEFDVLVAGGVGSTITLTGYVNTGNYELPVEFNSAEIITFTVPSVTSLTGSVSMIRGTSTMDLVSNQVVATYSSNTVTDDVSSANLYFGEYDYAEYAAMWYGYDAVWTTTEVQRFHEYVETLLDAFGAGVVT